MAESLWGDEFDLPEEKEKTKKIRQKISNPKEPKVTNKLNIEKQVKSIKLSLRDRLELIKSEVLRILGKQKDNILCIKDRETLHNYITKSIQNGRIDIDTETNNSLDPITCKLMGPCIYTPGEKQVYIPLNHRDPDTKERLPWQLTENDITEEFQRIIDAKVLNAKGTWTPDFEGQEYLDWVHEHLDELQNVSPLIIMHNGKFDYQVIKKTCNIEIRPDWDTLIACKLIDENEFSAGLKQQYISKIDPEQEKYDIEKLFEGVEYADVEPDIFAYYAATDAMMTDKLYEYQLPIMCSPDFQKIHKLFDEVEMPCVVVTAEMELQGVYFDKEYSDRLKEKYHKKLEELDIKLVNMLTELKHKIDLWKLTEEATQAQKKKQTQKQYDRAKESPNFDPTLWSNIKGEWYKVSKAKVDQLDEELTPDSLASPQQLGIILYDILKCPFVNKEKPYATGEDELKKLSKDQPLCKLMLEKRALDKLINAFIDSLPEKVNIDRRIHGHFNQYGAATGRFSSSEPNLQQIPSHNKEIRMLFSAQPGYMLISSDFSQQEPRLLSAFSQDENMINAYKEGKDLYATIAMGVYHNTYEENLEFNPITQQISAEGAARRSSVKSLLLGIMYGRGVASIAEQIHGTVEEAQQIIDNFYKSFPKVKKWIDESVETARATGYVEDLWGRRRRLPDINLPKFTVRYKKGVEGTLGDFNPFLGCINRQTVDKKLESYKAKALETKSKKQLETLKEEADKEGIEIINNGGFISAAERQCVNARIQGSAATMTKKAMIKIYNDKELRDLGFRLEIGVHDELIGEFPKENLERVAQLLTYDMRTAAEDTVNVPFKCDPDYSYNWYFNSYCSIIKQKYVDLIKGDTKKGIAPIAEEEAFNKIVKDHSELTEENIREVIYRDFQTQSDDDWEEELRTTMS